MTLSGRAQCTCIHRPPYKPCPRHDPEPESGLTEAWAEAEAALPDGWVVAGVSRGIAPMQFNEWTADAFGPWHRSNRSRESISGYGDSPAAALRALDGALVLPLGKL